MELDLNGRMELRTRLASYVLRLKQQQLKVLQQEVPLLINEPVAVDIYKKVWFRP